MYSDALLQYKYYILYTYKSAVPIASNLHVHVHVPHKSRILLNIAMLMASHDQERYMYMHVVCLLVPF